MSRCFWRGSFRRGDLGVGGFRFETAGKTRYMSRDYANSRGGGHGVLPDRLPGYAYVGNPHAHESFEGCDLRADSDKARANSAAMSKQRKPEAESTLRGGANPLAHFGTLGSGVANLNC